jgi:RHS repeat-associated protein
VVVVNGSPGVLTTGTVSGSHTYAAAGSYRVTVAVSDDDNATGQAQFTMSVQAQAGTKFFVVDQPAHQNFRYDAAGNPLGQWDLGQSNSRPRGVASDVAGTTVWVIDANKNVYVYGSDGTVRGGWAAGGLNQPQDIATDGTDIWIVDDAKDRVYRYDDAASLTSGSRSPTSSFALAAANGDPSGIVTDGNYLWVTDDHAHSNKVFVYNMQGQPQGSWILDSANDHPSGITLDPSDGTDLWVVDRQGAMVYKYAGATSRRSGKQEADSTFALGAGNQHPEGIADPPALSVSTPASGASVKAGQTVLIAGSALDGARPAYPVTINGRPVEVIDPAGNFFSRVTIAPGSNEFAFTATDGLGQEASALLTVEGNPGTSGAIDFAGLSNVTPSFIGDYARTSFNEGSNILYADLRVRNQGQYPADAPLVVGVRNVNDPTVRVLGYDGLMPDGTPYFDFGNRMVGKTLEPGGTTSYQDLSFLDPNRVRFTYDLVFLGRLNQAPAFTSVPVVEALVGQNYSYDADATDPDGDPLSFKLLTGPAGMAVDAATGHLAWSPVSGDLGNQDVTLRVEDGRGGSALQHYVLAVTEPLPNRPPLFTSTPVVDAGIATPYAYQAAATDPDGDPMTFSLAAHPAGMTVDSGTGLIAWTPDGQQLGTQDVTVQVDDGHGGTATQAFVVAVQPQPGNHAPVIISDPVTHASIPAPGNPPTGNVDPTRIDLNLQPGETADQTVSLTLPFNGGGPVPTYVNERGVLTIGETVDGLLPHMGREDHFTFTLPQRSRLYFDSMTNRTDMRWTLKGPAGTAVDIQMISEDGPVLNLPAGDYELTVNGFGYPDGSYRFRLLDLAAAQPLTPGTPVSGTLDPATSTNLYRFDAQAGDQFFFDVQARTGASHATWRLVDPYSNVLFNSGFATDVNTLTLPAAGRYTLLIEGAVSDTGTGSYTFNVQPKGNIPPVPVSGTPLTLGSVISGTIATAGEQDVYTFSLGSDASLYFDSLSNISNRVWALKGPAGTAVSGRSFAVSDGQRWTSSPVLSLAAGDYVLTISSTSGATGAYQFRLLDLGQATPLTPGTVTTATLNPANETQAYHFDAHAGDRYFFDSRTASPAAHAIWRLVDPYGNILFNTWLYSDVDALTMSATGNYTLLLEGGIDDSGTSNYTFVVQPAHISTEPLALGDTVAGTISGAGDQSRYVFSLTRPSKLYFDSLTYNSTFTWTLEGAQGTIVSAHDYGTSPVLSLAAGDYVLTVDGTGDATGAYQFRLLDLAQAIALTPGSVSTGKLAPANSTNAYRFDAQSGDRFFFDSQNLLGPAPSWRLVDTFGQDVFTYPFTQDVDTLMLNEAGTYTLLLEGPSSASGVTNYTFNVQPVSFTTEPLTLGQTVNGSITVAGEQDRYTFTLPIPTKLYFDALIFSSSAINWTLEGPAGTVVDTRSFSSSDGVNATSFNPVLSLPAGDCVLTVDRPGDATGAYRFRLLDLAAAQPLTPGTPVSGTLDPANSTNLYRFDAQAGDRFSFDPLTPSAPPNTYWRLVDPYGNLIFGGRVSIPLSGGNTFTLARAGTYTLLLEGGLSATGTSTYAFNVQPMGNVPPVSVTGTPLTLGATVVGTIATPGEQDLYTFSLAEPSLIAFDRLGGVGYFAWSLAGPSGPIVSNQTFNLLTDKVLNVVEGDYVLTVSGLTNHTGDYGFRLFDLATAQALTRGTPVSGTLDPADSTHLYRFDAQSGDRFLFDPQRFQLTPYPRWQLVDPYGADVFNAEFYRSQGTLTLSRAGTYTLLIKGDPSGTVPVDYQFNVQRSRPFALGDVFVAGSGGIIYHYDKDLNLLAILRTGLGGFQEGGMAFDPQHNLLVTNFQAKNITKFDTNGQIVPPNPFVAGDPTSFNESIVFDAQGNFYVGQATDSTGAGSADVFKFSPNGLLLDRFDVAVEDRGSDWVDLAPDQRTLYYTSEGVEIKRYDLKTHTQLADFAHLPGPGAAYAVRILPDGGVLVADTFDIKRLDANGTIIQTYAVPGVSELFGLNLDPDGKSFWSGNTFDATPYKFYRFDIESGQLLMSKEPNITDFGFGINGLAVYGELTAATWGIDVAASDPAAPFQNQTGIVRGSGPEGKVSFDAAFTGDGQAHSFDLLFLQAGTGNLLGTIPVTMGVAYFYPVRAIDPDGDALTYRLTTAATDAAIDSQSGQITWHPTTVGTYHFVVQVDDGRGGEATQTYDLVVGQGEPNQPPVITSVAPSQATVGLPRAYHVTATDPDSDPLSYYLTEYPQGMTIDRATGVVSWTPTVVQEGEQKANVRVLDGRGGQANQPFTVTVAATSQNRNPNFSSTPPATATVAQAYRYDAQADDPDYDPVQFDLVVKPSGMTVDEGTGIITWRPDAGQVGDQDVILRVADGRGGVALQAFVVTVHAANTAPVITSQPGGPASVGRPYQYQVRAQDAEGDPITFHLDAAPAGMAIDTATGLLTWTPTAAQVGSPHVAIAASDGRGGVVTQPFDLLVVDGAPNTPPVISSSPRTVIGLGNAYLYIVRASDPDGDPLTYRFDAAPAGMTVNDRGLIAWTPDAGQLGPVAVKIRVDDGRGGVAPQDYTLTVATTVASNGPPIITSTPLLVGTVGQLYSYDAVGSDPEHDPLVWRLDAAPAGMSIDPSLGTLRWIPTADQRGAQDVVVQVSDTGGAIATQSFTIAVHAVNMPPAISSVPPTVGAVGEFYTYAVRASDPEGDPLSYFLATAPSGMMINPTDGLIRWTPGVAQVGTQAVVVRAEDGHGGFATQAYTLVVSPSAQDRPPVITSTPPYQGTVATTYRYQVTASDPEGEPLRFSLPDAPAGMNIDPGSGLVQWTPTSAQLGGNSVTVAATDLAGNVAHQSFTLTVLADDRPPIFISTPVTTVAGGLTYRYDVRASDLDHDPLSFQLTAAPAGMAIDALGRITWATSSRDVGTHHVQVVVSDGRGGEAVQPFDLAVTADTEAPRVSLVITPAPAALGEPVTFSVAATDDVGLASVTLTYDGIPLTLDAAGLATFKPDQAGVFDVIATASDTAGNIGRAMESLTVIDRRDAEAPVVNITAPEVDAVITAPVDVIGTVTDASLLVYTLEVGSASGGSFTEFARGTTEVTNGVLGRFDPSGLANDSYILRLTAQDAGGHVTSLDVPISVAGGLKLGNFTLSFTDLSLPVGGIPITVGRTYDTLTASHSADLGYGWRLEFRDVDLRSSVAPTGYEQELGLYNPFRDGTRVYLTLPGGKREGFTFKPQLTWATQMLIGAGLPEEDWQYDPAFEADPGVTDKLTLSGATTMIRDRDTGAYLSIGGGRLAFNPANDVFFATYTLTTKDGIAYRIDAPTGLLDSVSDPNGNFVTFADAGISSTAGQHVTFGRDPQGRITSATDPAGNRVLYQYDANGDLVAVTDREGNVTRFVYSSDQPHYLAQVIDSLGRTGARTEYDAQGRLVKIIDAAGNPVQLIHDPSNSTETVKDALGNPTTYEYDPQGNIVTEVNALGGVTLRTYDSQNNQLTETDPLGRTTATTYDARGNVLTQTDPLGNVTRSTYDDKNHLLTETDPLGQTTRNTYDARGNLLTMTDAAGNTTTYAYADPINPGQPTSITDPAGNVTRFEYSDLAPRGLLMRQVDALGHETRYTYDVTGRQLTETRTLTTPSGPRTLVTTNTYDHNGNLTSVTDAEGNTTRYEYDALGHQIATIDALGRRTESVYDDRGQLVETDFPDGTKTTTTYDAAGRRIASTDQAGRTTRYLYDALGRLTTTIEPDNTPNDDTDNPRIRAEYNAAGQMTARIDELGHRTEFECDNAGRQVLVRDALGHETTSQYDADGRNTATTDALGHTTRFVYDDLGRLSQTVLVDGTTTKTNYDVLGRSVAQTDQLGRVTQYEYDALGRLTAVVDALGQRTEYGYDEAGDLISQKDANGHVTRYEYDGLGRRTATVLPLGQRSGTTYNALGNVATTTDFNGATITYKYDVSNQLREKDYPDGTSVAFTYTPTGQRATVTDARGVTTYAYDARDRLLSRTDPDGTTISYTYDAAGNRTSVTIPAGTTDYTFDALGRLETVTDPDGGVTKYTYDAAGNLVQTELPNGTSETRQYDALNRLVYLENDGPSGVISSYHYTLAPTGRRDAVVEDSGRRVDYQYDLLDRLLDEIITDSANGNRSIHYVYDPVGNRLSRDDSAEGVTAYAYDGNDRLLTETLGGKVTNYTYDANGNTLSRFTSAVDLAIYEWDAENRLVGAEVTDANGTNDIAYKYDADGIRVAQTVSGEETRFLVDTVQPFAQVLMEYLPSGLIKVSYVYGNDLICQDPGGARSYYHVDGLGSTRVLTDSRGQDTARYDYDAFGRTIRQIGETGNVYVFVGEQRDPLTGLTYLRARYLDVGSGRFTTRDRFEGLAFNPRTLHRFLYASGNPVNDTDPSGMFTLGELMTTTDIEGILSSINSVSAAGQLVTSLPDQLEVFLGFIDAGKKLAGFLRERPKWGFTTPLWKSFRNNLRPGDLEKISLTIYPTRDSLIYTLGFDGKKIGPGAERSTPQVRVSIGLSRSAEVNYFDVQGGLGLNLWRKPKDSNFWSWYKIDLVLRGYGNWKKGDPFSGGIKVGIDASFLTFGKVTATIFPDMVEGIQSLIH